MKSIATPVHDLPGVFIQAVPAAQQSFDAGHYFFEVIEQISSTHCRA